MEKSNIMSNIKSNVILIGMPGSGKSTVGRRLAGEMGMSFLDTDAVIYEREKRPLKEIVSNDGLDRFLEIQQDAIMGLNVENHVLATGGSVIYGEASMNHLRKNGVIVFLNLPLEEIESRMDPSRRLARNRGKSLKELYLERKPLYEKYADFTIDCAGKKVEDIAKEIAVIISDLVGKRQGGK